MGSSGCWSLGSTPHHPWTQRQQRYRKHGQTMKDTRFVVLLLLSSLYTGTLASWIDPDTPQHLYKTLPFSKGDSKTYSLVFSDEFNIDGRTFEDGADPRWTAMNKNDFTNSPLHYYSHEAVETRNGSLSISLSIERKDDLFAFWTKNGIQSKEFKSGMVQSWNKFCFTGGIVEFSAKMPGTSKVAGFWPAIWMMGNLGRATYVNSTENMWPFSTNVCDDRTRDSQLINSCTIDDHHYHHHEDDIKLFPGMPVGRGRGAPEIDILEVMFMDEYFTNPILSTSLQIAPGVPENQRPQLGQAPNATETWYSPEFGENASLNTYFYGTVSHPFDQTKRPYRTDSLSANIALNEDFYQSFHRFRAEWEPPTDDKSGSDGYIKWFVDGKLVTAVYGDDLQVTSQTEIPSEPMYLVMNLAVSKDWGFPDAYFKNCSKKCWSCLDPECACALPKRFCESIPTHLEIDSVRVYQPLPTTTTTRARTNEPGYTTGCSPPNRPTKEFIEAHKEAYKLQAEENPLKEIRMGGGACWANRDCGPTAKHGFCSHNNMTCVCDSKWTGPHCLASSGLLEEWTTIPSYIISRNINVIRWGAIALVLLLVCATIGIQGRSIAWKKSEKQMYHVLTKLSTRTKDDWETPIESPLTFESYQHGGLVPKVCNTASVSG